MSAIQRDLFIENNGSFSRQGVIKVGGTPVDLTGWTFVGQIRSTFGSPTVLATFDLTTNSPATDGIINIDLDEDAVASLPIGPADVNEGDLTGLVYDIVAYPPSPAKPFRLMEGNAYIDPGVTRG